MSHDRRVIAALDDLARELFLYLDRSASGGVSVEDPQGSLYDTLSSLETTFPASDQGSPRKHAEPSMDRAVDALPPEQRELLRLHLGEGMTCLEIAERSNRSREDVLFDLVRAYGHLRLHLGGDHLASLYGRGDRSND